MGAITHKCIKGMYVRRCVGLRTGNQALLNLPTTSRALLSDSTIEHQQKSDDETIDCTAGHFKLAIQLDASKLLLELRLETSHRISNGVLHEVHTM